MKQPLLLAALAILAFISNNIRAQHQPFSYEIEMGNPFELPEKRDPHRTILSDDSTNYFISYQVGYRGIEIRQFDQKTLEARGRFTIIENSSFGKEYFITAFVHRDTLHSFTVDDKKDHHTYYLQKIPLSTKIPGKKQEFGKVLADEKNPDWATRQFVSASDENSFALVYTVPNKSKSQQRIRVTRIDTNYNVVGTQEYQFPFLNKEFIYHTAHLTKDNELILLARIWKPREVTGNPAKYHHYKLFRLKEGEVEEIAEFELEKRILQPLGTHIIDDEFIASTCYSVLKPYAMKGTWYVRINMTSKEVVTWHRQGFDMEYFTQFTTGNKRSRIVEKVLHKTYEDYPYTVFYVGIDSLKSSTIIAEQIYIEQGSKYHTKDLAVIKLDSIGHQLWATKIRKNNTGGGAKMKFTHFKAYIEDGHTMLIYNGNRNNVNLTEGKVEKAFKKEDTAVMMTIVDSAGAYKRLVLIEEPMLGGYKLRPALCRWVEEGTLLLYLQSNKEWWKHRLAKVKIKGFN